MLDERIRRSLAEADSLFPDEAPELDDRRRSPLVVALGAAAFAVVVVVLATGLFRGSEEPDPVVTVPTTAGTTVTTTVPTTTVPSTTVLAGPSPESTVSGRLPDGTQFRALFEPAIEMTRLPAGISAAIAVDLADGTSPVVGITTFSHGRIDAGSFENDRYLVPTGDWTMRIEVYPHVLAALGSGPLGWQALQAGIEGSPAGGLPAPQLHPPFRWTSDDEVPLQMSLDFGPFVVQRGCGELAVACNETRAVQVIPADRVFAPAPEWPDVDVWVESPEPRPETDEYYLPPGLFAPRGGHDVLWTGSEMVVWGGAEGDRPPDLVDGAAFDPETSAWRILPRAPLEPSTLTRAVWAGDEMVVISEEATAAYDPVSDGWRIVAEGLAPPHAPGLVVWTGDAVALWNDVGIHVLPQGSDAWVQLPDVGFGEGGDTYQGALRVLDGVLYAIGNASGICEGREAAAWTSDGWFTVPAVSLRTAELADCSFPNQTAVVGGRMIVWEDETHPTMAYDPATDTWSEIATITLPGTEGAQGPVAIGDRILVPQWGIAAVYDPVTGEWTQVRLPGSGLSTDMVWTGDEVLMWGAACCYGDGSGGFRSVDAWRWRPGD
jgi:hypothetical protein